ncbi:Nn.00g030260.m01.CDS01 [Neocucurbitaria sp. VM-36]
MTSKPMVERRKSDNGHGNGTSPFLRPDAAQGSAQTSSTSTSTTTGNRLLPSPLPPPTASSMGSQRPQSRVSAVSGNSRDGSDGAAVRKSHSQSISSTPRTLASSNRSESAENKEKNRAVRTLPPWVQIADEDDNVDATSLLLPRTPTSARPASHHYMPTPKSTVPGRKFDHAREGAPVTLTTPMSDSASKWKVFAQSSNYDQAEPPASSRGQVVDDDWMKENLPDLETKWEPIDNDDQEERLKGFWLFNPAKRKRKVIRFHRTVMNHPMVPAVIRMVVLTFSILALALAGAIYHKSDSVGCDNNSSTWMAILVDVIAICYTVYITYDEYTSKPLGLRSHNAKMSLIFLDLAFIVFESANLSLAFQALTDDKWVCRDSPDDDHQACAYTRDICSRQKALTATLLIALLAWIGTFTISTLRLIHRVAR